MFQKSINSFLFAVRGLRAVWREEHNFRTEVCMGIIVLCCLYYFHFDFVESALCILAITMVLTAEIVNTAVEDVCDKVEPGHDPVIGKVKDVMGAYVLVTGLGVIAIACLVVYHHFFIS